MNEEEKKKEQQIQQQAQQGKSPAGTTAHVDKNGAAVPVAAPAPTPAPSPTANDLQQRLYGNRLTGSNEATRNYDAVAPAVPAPAKVQNQAPAPTPAPVKKDPYHLDELAQKISSMEQGYQPLTKEDLERERKKKKREAIFSALGDGISALSNLYFTTQGANNAYNPANSLSAKAKERWDEAKAEREAQQDKYLAYLYREQGLAQQRKREDEAKAEREEAKQIQAQHRAEDKSFREEQFEFQKGEAKKRDEREQRDFDENVRRFKTTTSQQNKQHEDRMALEAKRDEDRRVYNTTKLANDALRTGSFGKPMAFASKGGNFNIYTNVWKANAPRIYDAMVEEGTIKQSFEQRSKGVSTSVMENAVKANWEKSEVGKEWMKTLSGITPDGNSTQAEDIDMPGLPGTNEQEKMPGVS